MKPNFLSYKCFTTSESIIVIYIYLHILVCLFSVNSTLHDIDLDLQTKVKAYGKFFQHCSFMTVNSQFCFLCVTK